MVFSWLKSRRRRRLLAEPFPEAWLTTLERRVRQYRYLPAAQQQRVREIVRVMLAEKDWAPAAGFAVTDEMRVTIAGIAALIVSGLDEPFFYDRLDTVVIHPKSPRVMSEKDDSIFSHERVDGTADQWGPVLINWEAVREERRGKSQGQNIVVHEFAHHLDGLDGEMDGIPPMDASAVARWLDVIDEEMERLDDDARRGRDCLLSYNATESPEEFFAAASECFFELPHDLRREHPDLYLVLSEFYRQDPTVWMPR